MILRCLGICAAALFIAGCAHRSIGRVSPQEKNLYEAGLAAISKKEYQKAHDNLSELLSNFPTSRWLSGIYYNLGMALEGLGKTQEAAEKYKKVVEFYEGVHTREEAEALYRLSHCYEALAQDEKTVLTLLELQTHSYYLNRDAAEMEVPARLAAAYARMGNQEQARLYYAKAEGALKKRRRSPLSQNSLQHGADPGAQK
jgi:tetratricopeptide (TPR) repeat protein